jgi:hypothetical protein
LITGYKTILLEGQEYFVKQSYRNRIYINTEHGKDLLIIPLTGKHGKTRMKDVKIDYTQKWVNNHWRSIESAYGKAPFFEYYAEDIKGIFDKQHRFLFDFNRELLTMCLRWLSAPVQLKETLTYETTYANEIDDQRSLLIVKNTQYVDHVYRPVPYQQVFGSSFVENLSIIDLIFCVGPEAGSIIKTSSRRE